MDPAALATSGGTQFNTDPSQVQNFAQWQNMLQEYYKQGQAQMATNSAYAAPLTYGNIWGTNPLMYGSLPFYGGMFTSHFPVSQTTAAQQSQMPASAAAPVAMPIPQLQTQPQQQQAEVQVGVAGNEPAEEAPLEAAEARDKADVSSSQGETQQTGAYDHGVVARMDAPDAADQIKDERMGQEAAAESVPVESAAEVGQSSLTGTSAPPAPVPLSVPPAIPGPAPPPTVQLPPLAAYWSLPQQNNVQQPPPQPTVSMGSSDQSLPPGINPSNMDDKELKRLRRKQSNRESARRSRLRKQAETEQLSKSVKDLVSENNQYKQSMEHFKLLVDRLSQEKLALMAQVRQLGGQVPPEMEWNGLPLSQAAAAAAVAAATAAVTAAAAAAPQAAPQQQQQQQQVAPPAVAAAPAGPQ